MQVQLESTEKIVEPVTRNIVEVFWWDEDAQEAGLLCTTAIGRDCAGVYGLKGLRRDSLRMNGEHVTIDDVRAAAAVRIENGKSRHRASA